MTDNIMDSGMREVDFNNNKNIFFVYEWNEGRNLLIIYFFISIASTFYLSETCTWGDIAIIEGEKRL